MDSQNPVNGPFRQTIELRSQGDSVEIKTQKNALELNAKTVDALKDELFFEDPQTSGKIAREGLLDILQYKANNRDDNFYVSSDFIEQIRSMIRFYDNIK